MLATIEEWRSGRQSEALPRSKLEQDRHSLCSSRRRRWHRPRSPRFALYRLARERHRHAVDAAAAGGEKIELGIQDREPLGAQSRIDARAVARRDHAIRAERQEIARHRHHFAIGRFDRADSALLEPAREIVAQNLDAGDRKPRRSHADEDIEMKEMFGKRPELRLPALVREPARELRRSLARRADSRRADEQQPGPNDVDVAALDCAMAAITPEAVADSMEAQDGGDLAAAGGKRELGQRRPPGRSLARIARIDLIGQMRLGL
jgi:hypothetical protein